MPWTRDTGKQERLDLKSVPDKLELLNQVPYEMPSELRQAIESFAEYYNHRRHHEAPANATPTDVYFGRKYNLLARASIFTSSTFTMITNEVSSIGIA